MTHSPQATPRNFICWICLFCGIFLWTNSLYAAPISTFDGAGEPYYIEEEIAKAPDQYLLSMDEFLRKGQLDAIGIVARSLTRTKGEDPRVPAMYSIYLAYRKDLDAAKAKLKEAGRTGDTIFAQYAEVMILCLEKKYSQAEKLCEQSISRDATHPFPWNLLGRIQFDRGEFKKAYESFQTAVKLEADFLPGYINLGASAFALGDEDNSIHYFKKAIQLNPRASNAHLGLGLVYDKTGQYEMAAKDFEKAFELDPDNFLAIQELASSQIKAKQFEKALETGRKMEKLGLPDTYLILGDAALHLGKIHEAIQYLEQASPNLSDVNSLLGFCYMVQNQNDKALLYMDKALKINPNNFWAFWAKAGIRFMTGQAINMDVDLKIGWGEVLDKAVHFSRGCVHASKGDWAAATDEWRVSENLIRGFSIDGIDAQTLSQGMIAKELPHLNLGVLYFFNNLYDPAITQYTIALDKNQKSILTNYFAAQVFLNQGDRPNAISSLEKTLEHAPNFFTALYSLAELKFLAGKTDQAAIYYRRAIEVKKDPGILIKLALYHEKLEDFGQAEKYYQELIILEPEFYVGYNQLAWLYAKRGVKLDDALGLARKANELQPGNGSVLDTLGWIHYHKKEYDNALKYLKESEKVNPVNPTVLFHIGLTYHALGEKNKSHEYLEKALSINANFEGSEKAKEILNSKTF